MSGTINGLRVALEDNVSEERGDMIAQAIRMIRGVVGVTSEVADMDHYSARMQAETNIRTRLAKALYDKEK